MTLTETGPGLDNIKIPNYEISIPKNKNGRGVAILLKTKDFFYDQRLDKLAYLKIFSIFFKMVFKFEF